MIEVFTNEKEFHRLEMQLKICGLNLIKLSKELAGESLWFMVEVCGGSSIPGQLYCVGVEGKTLTVYTKDEILDWSLFDILEAEGDGLTVRKMIRDILRDTCV